MFVFPKNPKTQEPNYIQTNKVSYRPHHNIIILVRYTKYIKIEKKLLKNSNYKDKQTDKQTNRQTNRQTDKQTNRQKNRQTDTKK
jgi:hypothetical protein